MEIRCTDLGLLFFQESRMKHPHLTITALALAALVLSASAVFASNHAAPVAEQQFTGSPSSRLSATAPIGLSPIRLESIFAMAPTPAVTRHGRWMPLQPHHAAAMDEHEHGDHGDHGHEHGDHGDHEHEHGDHGDSH